MWMFDGYRMTAFTDEEEDQSKPGKIGLPWSLETALKNRGAIFDDGDAAWVSHVVMTGTSSPPRTRDQPTPARRRAQAADGVNRMSARSLAEKFFDHIQAGEVDEILGMMTPDATVSLVSAEPAWPDGGRRRGLSA